MREDSYTEMYPLLGDKTAQDALRAATPNKAHCAWLRRDPNACEAIPADVEGIEEGAVCPHHVYHREASVFANRDGVADTVDRIFRLVNSAELGLLTDLGMDPLSVTELITARTELDRQSQEKREQDLAEQRANEARVNQDRR